LAVYTRVQCVREQRLTGLDFVGALLQRRHLRLHAIQIGVQRLRLSSCRVVLFGVGRVFF
jgi:hypothetical protein